MLTIGTYCGLGIPVPNPVETMVEVHALRA
jgi:hypothetical protein